MYCFSKVNVFWQYVHCVSKNDTDVAHYNFDTDHHHTTTILRPFFWDHQGEPVPEENFWTLWCKGRLTEADTQTIQLGATPSGLTSADGVSDTDQPI